MDMASAPESCTHLLADLPSRGFFSSSSPSCFSSPSSSASVSAPAGLRLYICDHETAPPEDQVIKTDPTNILIRSLTIKKSKSESKAKEKQKSGPDVMKGKRSAERPADERISIKRTNTGAAPTVRKESGSSSLLEKDIQSCTVEKLRSMLKERNLPRTGKKEELVARLKQSLK